LRESYVISIGDVADDRENAPLKKPVAMPGWMVKAHDEIPAKYGPLIAISGQRSRSLPTTIKIYSPQNEKVLSLSRPHNSLTLAEPVS